jgi:CRISPR-associated exonuclease Cas4
VLLFSIALLIAALFLFLRSRHNRTLGGLPSGEVVYSDTVAEEAPVLVSRQYGLRGKPDSLVRTSDGNVIPVERKSGRAPSRPYDGDLAQATAYCILVEEHYGRRPPYMRLQYSDRYIDEPYTPQRQQWVLNLCQEVRRARRQASIDRSHQVSGKCRGCSQRQNCGQALQ